MPARNVVSTQSQIPQYHKTKKNTYKTQRHRATIQEIPEKHEKYRSRRCLIGTCVGCAIAAAVILAGLLPALIVTVTRTSTTNEPVNIVNTEVSSTSNTNRTNISSVTSASSTSNSGSTVSTGSNTSTSTSAYGFTAGSAVLSSTTAYYGYEQVIVSCSVNLINITVTITVQKTVNATYRGDYNTFWSGVMNQTYIDTGSQIIYIWRIISGQTVQANGGSPYILEAQFYLYGINQTTSADTYSVTATTVNGLTNTISGHF